MPNITEKCAAIVLTLTAAVLGCGESAPQVATGPAGSAGATSATAGSAAGGQAVAPGGSGGMQNAAGAAGLGGGGGPSEPVIPGGPDESIPSDPGEQPFVHPLFTDHMVLQRDAYTPIWGWSSPGDVVKIEIAGETYSATADQYGRWLVRIGPFEADGMAYQLRVSGPENVTFEDVKFGDVWLCGGQSNMGWEVGWSHNATAEIAASSNPDLRFVIVPRANLKEPKQTFSDASWQVVGPETISSFSAVCYFMVRELHAKLKVPMGMIGSYWGGTSVEAWMSAEKLGTVEDFRYLLDALPAHTLDPAQPHITTLYNGMIAPLLPYGLKGIAWYQGENNGSIPREEGQRHGQGHQYSRLMPAMIDDWRTRFRMGKLPFLQVQLANFQSNPNPPPGPVDVNAGWAAVREAQLDTKLADDKVGMAVIVDIGNPTDAHPLNKQDVGLRLAASALHVAYEQDVVYEGPIFKSLSVQGSKAQITFDSVGSGLMVGTKDATNTAPVMENVGGALTGFAMAGADLQWKPATAVIDAGGTTISVSSGEVPAPAAVRYGWTDNPQCNLYNREGLMASPFRSDRDYGVSVIEGAGGGVFAAGKTLSVTANAAPPGQHFVKWVGDVQNLDDANKSPATLTVPKAYVSIRATYAP